MPSPSVRVAVAIPLALVWLVAGVIEPPVALQLTVIVVWGPAFGPRVRITRQ